MRFEEGATLKAMVVVDARPLLEDLQCKAIPCPVERQARERCSALRGRRREGATEGASTGVVRQGDGDCAVEMGIDVPEGILCDDSEAESAAGDDRSERLGRDHQSRGRGRENVEGAGGRGLEPAGGRRERVAGAGGVQGQPGEGGDAVDRSRGQRPTQGGAVRAARQGDCHAAAERWGRIAELILCGDGQAKPVSRGNAGGGLRGDHQLRGAAGTTLRSLAIASFSRLAVAASE